ncbi:AAA family ATPase [Salinivibrio socompensis]|uniref:AAA family ATPase n=1 Tax=Salinivibrio socompensis TaxID=1510206 RepID=UPI0004707341|nr:AAA family ATPase [Salinivibrio socompensis]
MIISFSGTKGGTGKTSGAINFAYYCQQVKQLKTVVVDADPQGSARKLLRENREGLCDIVCFAVQGNCRADLKRLNEGHDIVIVDTGGHASDTLNYVLSVADMCVLPFNIGALDTAEAETAKGVIDFVHDFNQSLSVISYLNKVPVLPSMSHYADSAQQAIADYFEVAPARLVNRDKPYSGLAKGLTIFEIDDDSAAKAQSDFILLADHLLDKLEVSHAQR